ncbi:MAG: AAA family ATPase [Planctomycetes bacterium]|nr:AAA family ATPase [Planctomycetota bacterium]
MSKSNGTTTELLDCQPPASLEAERGVLGSIILDPDRWDEVADNMRPHDFYLEAHAKIYLAMGRLHDAGQGIDVTLLTEALKASGEYEAVGGTAGLAQIIRAVPVAAHAAYYAAIVREKAIAREGIHAATQVLRDAFTGRLSGAGLARRAAADFQRLSEGAATLDFGLTTAEKFMAEDDQVRYLVEGVLAEGQPFIVGGPAKSLKTGLLIDLALSLAVGGYWLGRFKVPEARTVVLMSAESGRATLRETLGRIARAAGVDPGVRNLLIADQVPVFASPEHLAAVESLAMQHAVDVLVCEPLYFSLSGDDANNLFKMGGQLRPITDLCRRLGITLCVAHHVTKAAGRAGGLDLSALSWSGIGEYFRQWCMIARQRPYVAGSGCHELTLSIGGSAGHGGAYDLVVEEGTRADPGGRRWDVTVTTSGDAGEARKADDAGDKLEGDRRELVGLMVSANPRDTKSGLRELSPFGGTRFNRVFSSLLADGTLVQDGEITKGNGQTYPAYKVSEGEPE